MILVLNFDKNPLYRSCDGVVNCEFDLYQEIIYEVGYNLSDLSDENIEDKSQLILGLLGKENDVFEAINSQITQIINTLVSDNPTGTHEITFPPRYIDWLRYNVNTAYRAIADSLENSNRAVKVSIEELYNQIIKDNVVRKAKNSIGDNHDIESIFVSGMGIVEKCKFIKDITDNFPSLKLADGNYEPLLWAHAQYYQKQGDHEKAMSIYKKIDTFDSWMQVFDYELKRDMCKTSGWEIPDRLDTLWKGKPKSFAKLGMILGGVYGNIREKVTYDDIIGWINENSETDILVYIANNKTKKEDKAQILRWAYDKDSLVKSAELYLEMAYEIPIYFSRETNEFIECNATRLKVTDHHIKHVKDVYDRWYDWVKKNPENKKPEPRLNIALIKAYLLDMQWELAAIESGKYELRDDELGYNAFHGSFVEKASRMYNQLCEECVNALNAGADKDEISNLQNQVEDIYKKILLPLKAWQNNVIAIRQRKIDEEARQQAEVNARKELIKRQLEGELKWSYIPGGEFIMGVGSNDNLAHEHSVTLSPFKVVTSTGGGIVSIVTQNPEAHEWPTWEEYNAVANELSEIYGEKISIISEAQYEYLLIHHGEQWIHDVDLYMLRELHSCHIYSFCIDDYGEHPYAPQIDPVMQLEANNTKKVMRQGYKRTQGRINDRGLCVFAAPMTENDILEQKRQEEEEQRKKEEEEQRKKEEEQRKKEEEERKQKAQEADFRKHVETLKKHAAELEANAANGIPYTPELPTDIKEAIDYFNYDRVACNGGKNWYERGALYGYGPELDWLVNSIMRYHDCRQTYDVSIRRFPHDFNGEMPWITTEYKKLLGLCLAYGIRRDIDYGLAYSYIKDTIKGPLVDKIKEYYDLDQQRRENGNKSVAPPVNDLIKLSDIFMNGDEAAGIHKDPRFAFIILKKAADSKSEEAKKRLARCYYEGIGVKKNIFTAKDLYPNIEKSMAQKRAITNKQNTSANNVKAKTGKKKKSTAKSIMGGCLFMIIGFGLLFLAFILSILF